MIYFQRGWQTLTLSHCSKMSSWDLKHSGIQACLSGHKNAPQPVQLKLFKLLFAIEISKCSGNELKLSLTSLIDPEETEWHPGKHDPWNHRWGRKRVRLTDCGRSHPWQSAVRSVNLCLLSLWLLTVWLFVSGYHYWLSLLRLSGLPEPPAPLKVNSHLHSP